MRICTLRAPPTLHSTAPVIETEGMVEGRDLYKFSLLFYTDKSENLYTSRSSPTLHSTAPVSSCGDCWS